MLLCFPIAPLCLLPHPTPARFAVEFYCAPRKILPGKNVSPHALALLTRTQRLPDTLAHGDCLTRPHTVIA
eukprot:351555-Chlamydomonas_euryale.AAC.3